MPSPLDAERIAADRALVTGASGFIGSRLVERLVAAGASVSVVVRSESTVTDHWEQRGVEALTHDGSTASMNEMVARARPDVVYHLATHFVARHQSPDIEPLIRSNVLFGAQLLDAMVTAKSTRLVNVGSAWQHYLDADYRPVSLYAASKQAFESILAFYCDAHPLRAVTLHLTDTYGPTDQRVKLLTVLRRAAGSGIPVRMTPGLQRIDLLHVEDAVDALLIAGARTERLQPVHELFRVSSEQPLSHRELVALYERVLGAPIPVEWGAAPYRDREVMEPWQGGTRLPGWEPRIPLDEGLRQLQP